MWQRARECAHSPLPRWKEKIQFYSFMSVIAWEELHGVEIVARINQIVELLHAYHHKFESILEWLANIESALCGSTIESPKSPSSETSITQAKDFNLRVQLPKE